MCLNPSFDYKGNQIWCRKCDICKQNRINDWVGRCIAESRYADTTHSVTLTYGPDENGNEDHIHSALLVYPDIQKYFKRLRKAGFKFKYLVAGEYGSEKRRAHWHMIIFWQGAHPPIEIHDPENGYNNPRWMGHEYWTKHEDFIVGGHTQWQKMTPNSVWYVCKYIQKQQKDDAQAMLRMSKKPPLGHEYFQRWAKRHVQDGITPQTLHYTFDGVLMKKTRKLRKYHMHGVTATNFLTSYCLEYVEKYKSIPLGLSDLVDEFIDEKYKKYYELEQFIKEKFDGKALTKQLKKDWLFQKAKQYGGVQSYNPAFVGIEPFATCKDGTFIQYGLTQDDPLELFKTIITSK